jgi:hypothetical protein
MLSSSRGNSQSHRRAAVTPTKTVAILRRLANDWRKEEKQLCEQFGEEIIPRSMRARRIKDTKVLDAAIAMIDRLEAAESDALEQARLNGVGSEREAALMAKLAAAETAWKVSDKSCYDLTEKVIPNLRDQLEAAERERDALRARIEAMERQKPVAWRTFNGEGGYGSRSYADNENYQLGWAARNPNHVGVVELLYLAPGAKGE